ncbi:hypothetical protein [Paenibacillus alvei]|uniref:Uncharacterized protein n=1 Tax=Paenibacillus alvei TaxID=44250 RepID=A0A383RA15_PAEAL|nr:hypothetical protein [Paenibacillus alvei]SYX84007.1 conserved protein of unknown function [Paenibacillus alvei]
MTTFPGSPRIQKGGIVLLDPASGEVQRIIALQYNPDTLTRTLQIHGISAEAGDRIETMRLKGPPTETFKLEAEIDATDQLEIVNQTTVDVGLYPQLAALETIVYPSSSTLQANNALAAGGTLEIMPVEAPLTLFIWSKNRIVPMILTEFSIVEEAFDPALNPIRAKVNLSMRVLSVNDVGFNERASSLYMAYQQQKERLASRNTGILSSLGIGTSAFTV